MIDPRIEVTNEVVDRAADIAYGVYFPSTHPAITGKERAWRGPVKTNPLRRAIRAALDAVLKPDIDDEDGETLAPDPGLTRLTDAERREYADLNAKVGTRDPDTGLYPHWTQRERDRVRELMRKMGPIEFAPSTEEMARRFGHRSRRGA